MSSLKHSPLGTAQNDIAVHPAADTTKMKISADPVPVADSVLQSIPLYQTLDEYEQNLSQLVASVDNFKPDVHAARALIESDKNLKEKLQEFPEYGAVNARLLELERAETGMFQKNKDILLVLNECYTKLNALPMVEQVQFENDVLLRQRSFLRAKDVLDYAMKLSKFTKIPPTFDRNMIGPINFIWPGDDSLRRGMLAMADVQEKEKQKAQETLEAETTADSSQVNATAEDTVKDSEIMFNGKHRAEEKEEETAASEVAEPEKPEDEEDEDIDLDLDLFNPDEF